MDMTWIDTLRLQRRRKRFLKKQNSQEKSYVQWIDLSSSTVRICSGGTGSSTLIFMTDQPNLIEHYETIFRSLINDYRVVIYESPGHGFSFPKPGFRFTLEEQVENFIELLHALAQGPYVLIAPCINAYVALQAAEKIPELISKLVLMNAPNWEQEKEWAQRLDAATNGLSKLPGIGQLIFAIRQKWAARVWYQAAVGKKENAKSLFQITSKAYDQGACMCWSSTLQSYFFTNRIPRFSQVAHPTLMIWGEKDRSHRKSQKESIKDYVPQAEIICFESAGHFPELEETDNFLRELTSFLKE